MKKILVFWAWYIGTRVSVKVVDSVFRQSKRTYYPENRGRNFLRNVVTSAPSYMSSYSRTLTSFNVSSCTCWTRAAPQLRIQIVIRCRLVRPVTRYRRKVNDSVMLEELDPGAICGHRILSGCMGPHLSCSTKKAGWSHFIFCVMHFGKSLHCSIEIVNSGLPNLVLHFRNWQIVWR